MTLRRQNIFGQRKLRLGYWNADNRVVDAERLDLEERLQELGHVELITCKSLDDPTLAPCDLMIIAAQLIPDEEFATWLQALQKRVLIQGMVWIPALVMSRVPFAVLQDIWPSVLRTNWYFDVIDPNHLASLPIRVANLLRIHDHLHELKRYSAELQKLSTRVAEVEAALEKPRAL